VIALILGVGFLASGLFGDIVYDFLTKVVGIHG
jgi:hypothetical protein